MVKTSWMVGLVLMVATGAEAGVATSNMNVTATVASSCSITAGAMAFGTYDPVAGSQIDGSATLSVACSKGAITTVTLGQGGNAAGGSTDLAPQRRMKDSGSNTLAYALYSDSGRSVTWGNTALVGVSYVSTSAAASNLTVYGRIHSAQDVPAGAYSDVVVATISF